MTIPFVNTGIGSPQGRLLKASFNTSIVRSADSFESITCASSVDATEIFLIPANTLVAPGDFVLLEIRGACLNNTGSNQRPNIRLTLDTTLICSPALGQVYVTATNPKPWLYTARIVLSSATTANVWATQGQGNSQGAGSLPQGTQYGDLATWSATGMFVRGIAFDPMVAHTLKAEGAWDASNASLQINPMERVMTAVRYSG